MSAVLKAIPEQTETFIQAQAPTLFSVPAGSELEQRIAEAAYYKAEKRGFEPGYEHEDWAAAENEVLSFNEV